MDNNNQEKDGDPSLSYKRKKLVWSLMLISSALIALLSIIFASLFGSSGPVGPSDLSFLSISDVISELVNNSLQYVLSLLGIPVQQEDTIQKIIVWNIRLPRILMGGLAGMGLAVAGTVMQALFRNPMADPFIIGIASGASVGASFAIIAGGTLGFLAGYAIPFMAFLTSLITVIAVYYISMVRGTIKIDTLLLSGIAIGSFMSAITSLLTYLSGSFMRPIVFWLMGGLAMSEGAWENVILAAVLIIPACLICMFFARSLNLLLLGEETARYRGLDVQMIQKVLLVVSSLITGVAVAFTGVIGFVGLIIPHVMRLITGPDHRVLLPVSALSGASFLILADVVAKTIIYPTELPVGIITALCGTPFFLYLLRKRKKTGWM
ncbi:MAG: FecCD family ABC transporter permease [Candidatus Hodarchaeales archaeon]|jgi:iron complex transport system permease protein